MTSAKQEQKLDFDEIYQADQEEEDYSLSTDEDSAAVRKEGGARSGQLVKATAGRKSSSSGLGMRTQ